MEILTNVLLVIVVCLLVLNVWVTNMLTAVEYQAHGGTVANTIHQELRALGEKLDKIVGQNQGMDLIPCYGCGKEISDKALSCPGCGAPINKTVEEYYPNGNVRARWTERLSTRTVKSLATWWNPVMGAEEATVEESGHPELLRTTADHGVTWRGNGHLYTYHENGRLRSRDVIVPGKEFGSRDGDAVGPTESYWENGKPKTRGNFRRTYEDTMGGSAFEGLWEEWYEDGSMSLRCIYVNGEEHGRWIGSYKGGQEKPWWLPGGPYYWEDRYGELDFDLEELCNLKEGEHLMIQGLYNMGEKCGRWMFGYTNTKDYGPVPPDLTDEYKKYHPGLLGEDTED